MAKVTINATAHIREGIMMDEDTRSDVLSTLGKNSALLRDVRDLFAKGRADDFKRIKVLNGTKVTVILRNMVELGAVVVEVRDFNTDNFLGSAFYGKTKFFACLDDCEE